MIAKWFGGSADVDARKRTLLGIGSFLLPLLVWCLVSYVPFIWHPKVLRQRSGRRGLLPGRHAGRQVHVQGRSRQHGTGSPRPARGQAGQPHLPARARRSGEGFLQRFRQSAQEHRRALDAGQPVAQHPDHLLGLPDLVAHRRAARHPVRHLRHPGPPERALHRILPLPAGAGLRRPGGGHPGHLRRSQDRDHRHRHPVPAGADHRQHHPQAGDHPDRGRPHPGHAGISSC